MERRLILFQQLDRVVSALNGVDMTVLRLKRHLDGDRTRSRADIIADGALGQAELRERDGAHLALGHRHNATLARASQKRLVRQSVRHDGIGMVVFDQHGAQGRKSLTLQLLRHAGGNGLILVAQLFADAHRHGAEAVFRQRSAQAVHAILAADERENARVRAHVCRDVVRAAMQADDMNVLIGRLQLCTEVGKRAQARQHADLAVRKQRQQLPRAAEKARVARHHDRALPVFAVRVNEIRDLLWCNGGISLLPAARGGIQHASRADEAVRLFDRAARLLRHRIPAARPDTDDLHTLRESETKAALQAVQHLRKGLPLPLLWPSDHEHICPGLSRRGDLGGKAARLAAVLRHEPLSRHGAQHGRVHLLGKRPLHR